MSTAVVTAWASSVGLLRYDFYAARDMRQTRPLITVERRKLVTQPSSILHTKLLPRRYIVHFVAAADLSSKRMPGRNRYNVGTMMRNRLSPKDIGDSRVESVGEIPRLYTRVCTYVAESRGS